jgi:hypothetical protein
MAACWRLTWFVCITASVFLEKVTGVYGATELQTKLQRPLHVVSLSVFETHTYATTLGSLIISSAGSNSGSNSGSFRLQPPAAPVPLALQGGQIALAGAASCSAGGDPAAEQSPTKPRLVHGQTRSSSVMVFPAKALEGSTRPT